MTNKTTITLTNKDYLDGYEGAFTPDIGANGEVYCTGWWGTMAIQIAVDDEGNRYDVYYAPTGESPDGEIYFDGLPVMVLDGDRCNVIDSVIIK